MFLPGRSTGVFKEENGPSRTKVGVLLPSPPKKRLAKKSSTDRNLKPRESWDIKQGPSQLGPSFRRQRSQNCEANGRQRNAPEQCCLPAPGRREANGQPEEG